MPIAWQDFFQESLARQNISIIKAELVQVDSAHNGGFHEAVLIGIWLFLIIGLADLALYHLV